MAEDQRLMTLAEAARVSGHSAVTLRQAAQRGRLRVERVGEGNCATLYVTQADLEAYLAGRRTWRDYRTTSQEQA